MGITIFNVIKKAAGGSVQDDFDVQVQLVWDTDLSPVAVHSEDPAMLAGIYKTQTDESGRWDVEVVENDVIEPAGSLYKITETERGNTTLYNEYYVSVESAATPSDTWVGDIIVEQPAWES